MNILVIAPHPDDEVLGCGGTIAYHTQKGDTVHVCFATKAYTPDWSESYIEHRATEIKNAHALLGIAQAHYLDFPTVKLDTIPQKEINDALARVVSEVAPEVVYLPHAGDMHRDHTIMYHAGLVVTRPSSQSSVKKVLCYETVSETEWDPTSIPFRAQCYQNIEQYLDIKIKAMQAYDSELKASPHPRSVEVLEALARKRGSESNMHAAEAFMLVREIQK